MDDVAKTLSYLNARPNIIVFGVGHSGTTMLARVINTLGWNITAHDVGICTTHWENTNMVRINQEYLGEVDADGVQHDKAEPGSGEFKADAARWMLRRMPPPWVIKDPRLIWCLDQWLPLFEELFDELPLMVYLVRNSPALARSYSKEGQPQKTQMILNEQLLAQRAFDAYTGPKLHLDFEAIVTAAARVNLNVDNLERLQAI